MAEHEIKLVASLDTSNINTNTGTTGATNRTTSSGGSSAVGTAIVGSQLGGAIGSITKGNLILGAEISKTIKLLIKSLTDGIYLINFHLHNVLHPLKEITKEFSIVNRGVEGISKSFESYERFMTVFEIGIKHSTG